MPDAFRKHMSALIDHLCDAGIAALVAMEDAKQITHDEKRALQYRWVRGMRDAQIVMSDPKAAVRVSRELQKEAQVNSEMEYGIRTAAERLLEHVLGQSWRVRKSLGPMESTPSIDARSDHFEALRKAVMAKPSEVKKRLAQKVTIKCSHCHQSGHAARVCPFKKVCVHCGGTDHTNEQCPKLPVEEVSPSGNDCADQPG